MAGERIEEGGCLCGRLRYRVTAAPLWVAHCHCWSCRRNTGSALATFVGFPKARFAYSKGNPKIFHSSPAVSRSFCGDCGTPISYEAERCADEIHLYVSTLDHPEKFEPQLHVFCAESLPWLKIDDSLPRYAGTSRDPE